MWVSKKRHAAAIAELERKRSYWESEELKERKWKEEARAELEKAKSELSAIEAERRKEAERAAFLQECRDGQRQSVRVKAGDHWHTFYGVTKLQVEGPGIRLYDSKGKEVGYVWPYDHVVSESA